MDALVECFRDLYPHHGTALPENMLATMWAEIREARTQLSGSSAPTREPEAYAEEVVRRALREVRAWSPAPGQVNARNYGISLLEGIVETLNGAPEPVAAPGSAPQRETWLGQAQREQASSWQKIADLLEELGCDFAVEGAESSALSFIRSLAGSAPRDARPAWCCEGCGEGFDGEQPHGYHERRVSEEEYVACGPVTLRAAPEGSGTPLEDDREPIAEGDYRYYQPSGTPAGLCSDCHVPDHCGQHGCVVTHAGRPITDILPPGTPLDVEVALGRLGVKAGTLHIMGEKSGLVSMTTLAESIVAELDDLRAALNRSRATEAPSDAPLEGWLVRYENQRSASFIPAVDDEGIPNRKPDGDHVASYVPLVALRTSAPVGGTEPVATSPCPFCGIRVQVGLLNEHFRFAGCERAAPSSDGDVK